MSRRAFAGAGAAAIGAATAVTALVLGTVTGHAQTGTSSAFGVSAEGLIPIEPTPYVESTDGSEQTNALVDIPLGENGQIRAATLTAGDDTASVELAGVKLTGDPGTIEAKVINVACEGDTGTVSIVDLDLNGTPVVIPPPDSNPVNEVIEVPGVAKITYNQQMTNDDGTFTVNALVIELLSDTEAAQKVTLGSATCGGPGGADDGGSAGGADDGGADDGGADDGGADDGGADGGADGGGDDGSTATSPAPITTGLPVTG